MCCSKDLKHPSNFRDLKYLILNKYLVDVSTRTSWLNFKTVNISILNETQKTKITFSAPKSYRVFREMGHSFMISFRTLRCKLVIVQHQHWKKKTELRQWSYHFQDLEVSFHTDDHVIFFLGYSTKVSFFSFFIFFYLLRYPHSFYSLGVTSMLFSQQYHPWIKL